MKENRNSQHIATSPAGWVSVVHSLAVGALASTVFLFSGSSYLAPAQADTLPATIHFPSSESFAHRGPVSDVATETSGAEDAKNPEMAAEVPLTDLEVVEEAWKVIEENFMPTRGRNFDPAEWEELLKQARASPPSSRSAAYSKIRSMLATLDDRYTRFLSPKDFEQFSKYDITGIGLNLVDDPTTSSGVKVLGLVLESPSYQGGVRQ
ncbi:hypothetical protein CYMTET_31438, partial [Cymbomonas tetramitiformis]